MAVDHHPVGEHNAKRAQRIIRIAGFELLLPRATAVLGVHGFLLHDEVRRGILRIAAEIHNVKGAGKLIAEEQRQLLLFEIHFRAERAGDDLEKFTHGQLLGSVKPLILASISHGTLLFFGNNVESLAGVNAMRRGKQMMLRGINHDAGQLIEQIV